jgi:hypothetical protein
MPRPKMLRCEWLSRCGAPLEAQAQALRDVIRVEPSNTEAPRWLEVVQRAQNAAVGVIPMAAVSDQAVAEQPASEALFSSAVFIAGVDVG